MTLSGRNSPEAGRFPVVGIGASAGGLEAFRAILDHVPAVTGMAFVLISHLDPAHKSTMADILSTITSMPIREVTSDGVLIERNHAYVIAPNTLLTIHGERLHTAPREHSRGGSRCIDRFLVSLADSHREQAIAVVLSGTGSDGSEGIRAVRAGGGLTFAQDGSAPFPEMPRSAAATGCVDLILPPHRIAESLTRIVRHHGLVDEQRGSTGKAGDTGFDKDRFQDILRLLHRARKVDFRKYKETTLLRRISRRMALCRVDTLDAYFRLLDGNPGEVTALHHDLLINVTSFFREESTFRALQEKVFPELAKDRSPQDSIRVWVPGCSSGQEVYSLAIALLEFLRKRGEHIELQLFGTDVSETAVNKARQGRYPPSIEADVSQDRLHRFFRRDTRGEYVVSKGLRDLCVFAVQDVTQDPPLSRLDLVSCRNLLIYLKPEAQRRVLPLCHYALKPRGFLLLGSSETVGKFTGMFSVADSNHKIYAKTVTGSVPPDLVPPGAFPRFTLHGARNAPEEQGPEKLFDVQREADRLLLSMYAPPGIVVDPDGQIVQIRGETGAYLTPAPGRPAFNVLKMVREDLRSSLDLAIREAKKKNVRVRKEGIRLQGEGRVREVGIEVFPIGRATLPERCCLVLFHEAPVKGAPQIDRIRAPATEGTSAEGKGELARLREEAASFKAFHQEVTEKYEEANEDLRVAHEGILSANEELQATNEELETAKEELQSTNEELTTLNDEVRHRNRDLGIAMNDLTNLIRSVNVPIVMVDRKLTLRRFSPAAQELFSVTPCDQGRRLTDFRQKFDGVDLETLALGVMDTELPVEREVRDEKGRWFSLKIHPYRTVAGKIEGAVIALLDVDSLKRSMVALENLRTLLDGVIETVPQPLLVLDTDLRVVRANRSFYTAFAVAEENTKGRLLYDLGNRQWDIPKLRRLLEEILPRNRTVEDYEVEHGFEGIGRRTMVLSARRILQPSGSDPSILLTIEDVTEKRNMERRLAGIVSERERDQLGRDLHDGVGQDLAGIGILCQLLEERPSTGEEISDLQRLSALLQKAVRKTRTIARGLYPVGLNEKEMGTYLSEMAGFVEDTFRVRCSVSWQSGIRLGDVAAVNVYWIVHEAVHNSVRHGKARTIYITGERRGEDCARVTVHDDGKGLPEGWEAGKGLGISIMKSRAETIGGRLHVCSHDGGGVQVTCEFPEAVDCGSAMKERDSGKNKASPPGEGGL